MPKYIATELSFINDRLVQPGEEVEYDGEASENLVPVDADEAPKGKPAKPVSDPA